MLAIIPARAGSRRVAGKNMRELAGKPLVGHVAAAASEARRVTRTVLSSDFEAAIEYVGAAFPQIGILRRPAAISGDKADARSYVLHALEYELGRGAVYDAVAIVQPSSPFTTAADIDGTLALLETSGCEGAASVRALEHDLHPGKLKRLNGARLEPYFEEERGFAAHELDDVYVRNGSVYAVRVRDAGVEAVIPADCAGYVMPAERSVDINDELDLAWAEFLLARAAGTKR